MASDREKVDWEKPEGRGLRARTWLRLLALGVIALLPHHAAAQSQLASFSTIDISATINHNNMYGGGVLAGNGRVYFAPWNANNIGELDPSTGAFSTIDISGNIRVATDKLRQTWGHTGFFISACAPLLPSLPSACLPVSRSLVRAT